MASSKIINTSRIEDWNEILKNCHGGPRSWSLEERTTIYNHQSHRKVVYPPDKARPLPNYACENYLSFELTTTPAACVLILDFDYVEKEEQYKEFFQRENKFIAYLKKHPSVLYWEQTISNGVHVIMCTEGPSLAVDESKKIISDDGKCCEFKKDCLVAPSQGYRSECGPAPLARLSLSQVDHVFKDLTSLYFGEPYNISAYVNFDKSKRTKKAAPTTKKSAPPLEMADDGGMDEFLSSQYVSANNFQEDNVGEDAERVFVEIPTPEKAEKAAGKRKRQSEKSEKNEKNEKSGGGEAKRPRATKKPGTKDKDLLLDTCESRLDRHFDYDLLHNEGEGEDEAAPDVSLSPVDALYLKLIEKIADNADVTCIGRNIARDIVFAIFQTLRTFVLFIKKQEDQREIELFPVNVQLFLEILLCSDVYMKKDPYSRFYHERITDEQEDLQLRKSFSPEYYSIFSRLGSTPHWIEWTSAFQRLLDKIQITNPGTGHLQDGAFDAYALYRTITKLNVVGAQKDESEARAEYYKQFDELARDEIHNARTKWSLFFEFILVTLGSIHLNSVVVSQFKKFVDFATRNTGEMTIYCNIFQDIKLQGVRFEMSHIMEEVDRGKTIPIAVINFFKYPWVKTNTPWFHTVVAKFFPNMTTETIERFIENLGMRNRSLALGPKRLDFCHWSNCIPFENGIFDFEFFFKHLEEITRNEDAQKKQREAAKRARTEITTSGELGREARAEEDEMFSLNDFSRRHYELTSKDISSAFTFDSIREYIRLVLLVRKHNGLQQIEQRKAQLDDAELEAYMRHLCEVYRFRYNILISPSDFDDYRYFSVFRHYHPTDTVFKPIQKSFSPREYLETFFKTPLLSLDNHARYSPEFCAYIRSLFGTNASEGLMGPFQYSRLLVVMLIIAQGFLRTKLFQVSLNLVGPGSNGKSFFMWILKRCLGDKMANVQSKVMYGNTSETNQQAIGLEEAFFVYDQDADFVELPEFKKGVADIEGVLKRRLYHSLDRTQLDYTTPIFCSNTPLRYNRHGADDKTYEYAFHRRLVVIPYYNTVGKIQKSAIDDLYNMLEDYQEKMARGELDSELTYAEYEQMCEFMEEKTLFAESGFNLKDRSALHNIQLGLFWYLLDVLHVFGLASLSASSNDYVTPSLASQRLLGQANYYYLRLLLDHYYCLDQIETRIEVIARAPPVDLYEFYKKFATKNFKPETLHSICDSLRHCFGINIIVNTTISDSMHPTSLDDGYSGTRAPGVADSEMSGVYLARGLIYKNAVTPEQMARFNRQPYADFSGQTGAPAGAEIATIPIGHRFRFGPITGKVNEVNSALCRGGGARPWTKPVLDTHWRHTTLAHLF